MSIEFIIFIMLFAVGYIAGSIAESRHYASIADREQKTVGLPTLTMKHGYDPTQVARSELATGSVVISVDYFKRILAALRNVFGGNVGAYESLVDRARREATLRMKESVTDANMIVNVRIETSTIGQSADSKRAIGSIEALAYGTAIWLK